MPKKIDSFANRLNQLLDESNMSKADLSRKTGFRTSSISDWTNGLYDAKQDKVDVLSRVFNVNPAYLMGYDVEKRTQEKVATSGLKVHSSNLSKKEKKLLKNFNRTTAIGKQRILTTSEEMVKLYPAAPNENAAAPRIRKQAADPANPTQEEPEKYYEGTNELTREYMLNYIDREFPTAAFSGKDVHDLRYDELVEYYYAVLEELNNEDSP